MIARPAVAFLVLLLEAILQWRPPGIGPASQLKSYLADSAKWQDFGDHSQRVLILSPRVIVLLVVELECMCCAVLLALLRVSLQLHCRGAEVTNRTTAQIHKYSFAGGLITRSSFLYDF